MSNLYGNLTFRLYVENKPVNYLCSRQDIYHSTKFLEAKINNCGYSQRCCNLLHFTPIITNWTKRVFMHFKKMFVGMFEIHNLISKTLFMESNRFLKSKTDKMYFILYIFINVLYIVNNGNIWNREKKHELYYINCVLYQICLKIQLPSVHSCPSWVQIFHLTKFRLRVWLVFFR